MKFRMGGAVRVRVSALIVEDGRVLLIAHKKKDDIYWLLPCGGVGFGETLPQALEREMKEELGISLEVGELLLVSDSINPDARRHIVNVVFRGVRRNGDMHLGNDRRLYTYRFFGLDELDDIIIFPPLRDEIGSILSDSFSCARYQATQWLPL